MNISKQAKLQLAPTWFDVLKEEMQKDYWKKLQLFLDDQSDQGIMIYPPINQLFSAFSFTDFQKVRIVILGQDPYHGNGQANGLSFSVRQGHKVPPSLRNIFIEIRQDLGIDIPNHGCLRKWSHQGVFLLNSVLTVEDSKPAAHAGHGWENFTNAAIEAISSNRAHVVFMLWGRAAREKRKLIDESKHLILEASHPSPLSCHRGFFGSQHFSTANQYLAINDFKPIDWELDSEGRANEQMQFTLKV